MLHSSLLLSSNEYQKNKKKRKSPHERRGTWRKIFSAFFLNILFCRIFLVYVEHHKSVEDYMGEMDEMRDVAFDYFPIFLFFRLTDDRQPMPQPDEILTDFLFNFW